MAAAYLSSAFSVLSSTVSSALSAASAYFGETEKSKALDMAIEAIRKGGFVTCKVRDDSRVDGIFRRGKVCPLEQLERENLLNQEINEKIKNLDLPCEFPEEGLVIYRSSTIKANELGFRDCYSLNLYQDEYLPEDQRLDARLVTHYQRIYDIQKESLAGGEEDEIHAQARNAARRICDEIRKRIFENTHFSLGATHNRVEGKPEYVVILKGNADSCIGHELNERGDVRLLAPYQNDGKFFSLDLKDRNVLIVAPRKIARIWGDTYRIFAHEDLTREQKLFFYHT